MARECSRNPGLYRSIWLFPTLHATKEVFHMIDGAVAVAVLGQGGILISRCVFPVDAKPAAVDLQRCLRTAELQVAIIDRGSHHSLVHDVEAGVTESRLNRVGTIPLVENIF